jgi:hypothetical protein
LHVRRGCLSSLESFAARRDQPRAPHQRRRARQEKRWALSNKMLATPLRVVGLGHEQPVPIFQQLAGDHPSGVMMYVRYPLLSLRRPPQVIVWTKCDEQENRMIRVVGPWLVGCSLCVAADEDMYDGPTAIKPLTVTPQPQHSARRTLSATSSISATRRRADPRTRLPWLHGPLWSNPSRPDSKSPMNPSSRRGKTAWVGPCRTTSSRTTSTPCRWPQGAVRCGWRSRVARTTPGQHLRPRSRHHRLTADGISVAAGGLSAAMPIATVRRGVVTSDDRKRDATQPQASRPPLGTIAQRRLRPSAAQRRGDGWGNCTNRSWAPAPQHGKPGGREIESVQSARDRPQSRDFSGSKTLRSTVGMRK